MRYIVFTIGCLFFCLGSLSAQQQTDQKKSAKKAKTEIQSIKKDAVDTTLVKDAKQIFNDVKDDIKGLKGKTSEKLKGSTPQLSDKEIVKDKAGEQKDKILNEKNLESLQYDSGHPENAPWKNKDLPEKLLNGATKPNVPTNVNTPDISGKADEYKEKLGNVKPGEIDADKIKDRISNQKPSLENKRVAQLGEKVDSLMELKKRIENTSLQQELLASTRVYSDKYKRKLYDSLGMKKADSIFGVLNQFAKIESPKHEMLQRVNSEVNKKLEGTGVGFDQQKQQLNVAGVDQISGLQEQYGKKPDISTLQLPPDVLAQLPPLPGFKVDDKYLPVIDSMRDVAMKAKNIQLDEKTVTDEVKQIAIKRKPSFVNKIYFEGILGVINDTTISIVQIAPSLGYHFTDNLSVGAGPTLSVELQNKKINGMIGFRSFVKAEFLQQRVYVQIEDNMQQIRAKLEDAKTAKHSLLVGAGGILPITKKLGINAGIFYRVNQQQVQPNGSPWVFRIGLSSIKQLKIQ
jgi:hypothetical protein